MVLVPGAIPATIPFDEPIVAIPVLLLDHVPPAVPSLSDVVCPTQTIGTPEITVGKALTVTIAVVVHPNGVI